MYNFPGCWVARAFAVNSIRQWWLNLGRTRYPNATRLLITADGGGSKSQTSYSCEQRSWGEIRSRAITPVSGRILLQLPKTGPGNNRPRLHHDVPR